ncbi:amino acid ABC transporter [Marinomonas ushuaiensis DSM 15871]|uniref:Amino acid ABC transporter n=1 Tax=Marinomonas ushuaiensis DSM 15871 TaxID=1122207 RepID=X7E9L7_9GAMM|nr:amino acid ABC transporter permease [Marinomonas ushuaiensis]ETX12642.1 amino acid ABC transporter [Marinomonas ushuaiensis DSM 15871]
MLDFSTLPVALPLLWDGVQMTLFLSLMAVVLGLMVGVLMCLARLSSHYAVRFFAQLYISLFRGVPLLVQLMVTYYCLPLIGINIPALVAATACIGLCASAYMTEILRGGFLSLPTGQKESATMVGLNQFQVLLFIELPQVIRLTIPGIINEAILLVKASSLISAVGITELTRISQNLASSNFQPFEFYLTAAGIYFIINSMISAFGFWLEARINRRVIA